jgi:hypothetical protein
MTVQTDLCDIVFSRPDVTKRHAAHSIGPHKSRWLHPFRITRNRDIVRFPNTPRSFPARGPAASARQSCASILPLAEWIRKTLSPSPAKASLLEAIGDTRKSR